MNYGINKSLISGLLDLRDCTRESFKQIHKEMLRISLFQQPWWFRQLLKRIYFLQKIMSYDHWSRAWEYPWAIMAADLNDNPLMILDVGGGGSPFSVYCAQHGHNCYVIDPSLNDGLNYFINKNKGFFGNLRSLPFSLILRIFGITRVWGKPTGRNKNAVQYYPHSATDIKFPDKHFDRVFCLSVMEHIPVGIWEECIKEFERVLKPGGRLIITLDMNTHEANEKLYLRLVKACKLQLIGNPEYDIPISMENKQIRHQGQTYETIGLVWQG